MTWVVALSSGSVGRRTTEQFAPFIPHHDSPNPPPSPFANVFPTMPVHQRLNLKAPGPILDLDRVPRSAVLLWRMSLELIRMPWSTGLSAENLKIVCFGFFDLNISRKTWAKIIVCWSKMQWQDPLCFYFVKAIGTSSVSIKTFRLIIIWRRSSKNWITSLGS